MDKLKFKDVLLEIAVCAIACDGDIDDREKTVVKNFAKETPYFLGVDISKNLDKLIDTCIHDIKDFTNSVFTKLNSIDLNIAEELVILEIALRIIAVDGIEHDTEKEFIKSLRKQLYVEDRMIFGRFGRIDYLSDELGDSKTLDDKLGNEWKKDKIKLINNDIVSYFFFPDLELTYSWSSFLTR